MKDWSEQSRYEIGKAEKEAMELYDAIEKGVLPWIKAAGLEPRTTSVNEFRPVTDWNAIYETERTFRELSYRKNVVDKQYYPGFFVVLAQRPRTGE